MALLNYTTKIEVAKTVNEVRSVLAAHGISAIMETYDEEKQISGLSFAVKIGSNELAFRLPVDTVACYKVLELHGRRHEIPSHYATRDQARRVAWRIIKDWVEAQMGLVRLQMARVEQVFLPYMLDHGQTVYEAMIQEGRLPLMLAEGKS